MTKKKKNLFLEKINTSDSKLIENECNDKESLQRNKTFNNLTAKEWARLSKPIWDDLSSPRNKFQMNHGAVFPVKLVERLLHMYSKVDDRILDPFLGVGTTLIGCQNLGRNAIGIELNKEYANIAKDWVESNYDLFNKRDDFCFKVVNDDCRNISKYIEKDTIQLTITSPPYADFIQRSLSDRENVHKKSIIKGENNSTIKQYSNDKNDFGNLEYQDFLKSIKHVLKENFKVTKKGGYSCWVVKDHRDTKNGIPYISFHSDLAKVAESVGWKNHDLIIWDQSKQRRLILLGYPSVFYTNQNLSYIVILRKI